jgi:hypothetical protein
MQQTTIKEIDFTSKVQEVTGFNYDQKMAIFKILTTFGIPILPGEEQKEDWVLLRSLIDKQIYGEYAKVPMQD